MSASGRAATGASNVKGDAFVATTLTNPGIIDRLEQDIADYLSPFGFSLERSAVEEGAAIDRSSTARAVLLAPRRRHSYASGYDDTATSPAAGPRAGPIGTIRLHVHQESLIHTVGPLLRTFLRLSPHHMDPSLLRAVIHCEFTLDALEKFDKMNSEQKRNHLGRQAELSARKMAHHVHMIVRNSMGSALCMDLAIVLPCYWRRKLEGELTPKSTVTASKEPVSVQSVIDAMVGNPDACYPSVHLMDHSEGGCDGDEISSDNTTIHLDVRTRMCTVRHQPLIFRWIYALQNPLADFQLSGLRTRPCNNKTLPLFVVCIEKVANLHRILMLCHDYDDKGGSRCRSENHDDDVDSSSSSLLSKTVVVMPNTTEEQKDKVTREFNDAIGNFHRVIVDSENKTDIGGSNRHRPKLIYEENAAEQVSSMIERSRPASQQSQQSILGIDLHPDALTLEGDYDTNTDVPALQRMKSADAIIFGYESTGIPATVANLLNGWVQIPSRSSINVAAAISIVLDAIIGLSDCVQS